MKILNLMLLMTLMISVSCSNSDTDGDLEETNTAVESIDDAEDFSFEDSEEDLLKETESTSEEVAALEVADENELINETERLTGAAVEKPLEMGLGQEEYRVQKGDTLMMIAFKVYSDYRMWRKIASENPGLNHNHLKEGMVVKFTPPSEKFEWNPEGLPYLIKRGDTLGLISKEKYGTPKKWKSIYENNRPLIKNPNLIFAGFTLYYKPNRDIASE